MFPAWCRPATGRSCPPPGRPPPRTQSCSHSLLRFRIKIPLDRSLTTSKHHFIAHRDSKRPWSAGICLTAHCELFPFLSMQQKLLFSTQLLLFILSLSQLCPGCTMGGAWPSSGQVVSQSEREGPAMVAFVWLFSTVCFHICLLKLSESADAFNHIGSMGGARSTT